MSGHRVVATSDNVYRAVPGHVVAEASDELVLLHQYNGVYFALNTPGRRIWELVQEGCTLSQIVDAVVSEYNVDAEVAAKDIECLLAEMRNEGLISCTA